ncbi:MAG: hypothetical protein HY779_00285 [Rubrobacteridae bacterium]|nr:hypothetical protein [Rubrobacteridae bacterium]
MLHIALQDGFTDDDVSIKVDGKEVFRNKHTKTRTQIGYADSFELALDNGLYEIEVLLPKRTITEKAMVPVTNTVYLGISISDSTNNIVFRIEHAPFGYL